MAENTDDDWERRLNSCFQGMAIQDKETGEYWCSNVPDKEAGEPSGLRNTGAIPKLKSCGIVQHRCCSKTSFVKWRIPKEYSRLGCTGSADDDFNCVKLETHNECKSIKQDTVSTCIKESTVFTASIPPTGRLPAFCRKRQLSANVKEQTCTENLKARDHKIPRFLEGREGYINLGRLLLALFSFLIPGFMLPIVFIVKLFCHYHHHENDTEYYLPVRKNHIGSFVLQHVCRVCREQTNSENLFQHHSTLSPVPKFINTYDIQSIKMKREKKLVSL